MEYFTADELVRLYPQAEQLHDHLIEKIMARNWDVVCQLAYQLSAQRTLSHKALINLLCRDARESQFWKKLNILSFLARTMDLLYPMPPERREAIRLCVEVVLENLHRMEPGGENYKKLAREILGSVCGTSEETLRINASEINNTLERVLLSSAIDTPAQVMGLVLSDDLNAMVVMTKPGEVDEKRRNFWNDQSKNLAATLKPLRLKLAKQHFEVALVSWWRLEMDAKHLCALFGLAALFRSAVYPLGNWYKNSIGRGIVDFLVDSWVESINNPSDFLLRKRPWIAKEAQEESRLLLNCSQWQRSSDPVPLPSPLPYFHHLSAIGRLRWPNDNIVAEGVLVNLAVLSEHTREPFRGRDLAGTIHDLVAFYDCRRERDRALRLRAHEVVEERCNSEIGRRRLHEWVDGTISFTKP